MAAVPREENENDAPASRELADAGADLAGALVGGAVGSIGGPIGIVGGAALGIVVEKGAKAAVGRLFGRERERAGAALVLLADDAANRQSHGDHIRSDGFFDEDGGLRSDAVELLEGVLRQAASAYEERKLPLIARLWNNVAFDESVAPADAQFVVAIAGALTYRQFVGLSVIAHGGEYQGALAWAWSARQDGSAIPDPAILAEIDDAAARRLVGVGDAGYVYGVGESAGTVGSMSRTEYSTLRLTAMGQLLVQLTSAEAISSDERRDWIDQLHGQAI